MGRTAKVLRLVCAAAAMVSLLCGCGGRAVWKPLFDTPGPDWTPPPQVTTPGVIATPDAEKMFTSDVDAMANPRIVVSKAKHTLELWDGTTLMARMQVALGKKEGPKTRSNDGKTPEGDYFIYDKTDKGRYYKYLFISYPNSEDAEAGLKANQIKQDQYDEITKDIENGKKPPQNTVLGGEIAVSGTGTIGKGLSGDWTGGNVALSDEDMDYLWKYAKIGMTVEIDP